MHQELLRRVRFDSNCIYSGKNRTYLYKYNKQGKKRKLVRISQEKLFATASNKSTTAETASPNAPPAKTASTTHAEAASTNKVIVIISHEIPPHIHIIAAILVHVSVGNRAAATGVNAVVAHRTVGVTASTGSTTVTTTTVAAAGRRRCWRWRRVIDTSVGLDQACSEADRAVLAALTDKVVHLLEHGHVEWHCKTMSL